MDLLRQVHPTGRKSSPLAPYLRTVLYTKKPTLLNQQTHHGVPLRSSSHTYGRAWKRKVGRPRADRRGRLHDRTTAFIGAIKWQALTSLAIHMRSVDCQREKYSVGHFNLVRRLQFADGVSWIARLRLPDLPSMFGQREALNAEDCMRIEIATMKYLRYAINAGAHPHGRTRESWHDH